MKSRRDLLRSLGAGGFLDRLAPPTRPAWRSANPARKEPVIRAGQEVEVMALLGPLATGPAPAGYALSGTIVSVERIEYGFTGPGGTVQVILIGHGAAAADEVHASTESFRVVVTGDAPAEEIVAVGDAVTREVRARDHGQLWSGA
jgi:hypothetical protein